MFLTISNSVSIIFSSIMIFFYIKFKNIRNFAFRLVCFLNISDLIWSLANIINIARNVTSNDFLCTFQAFLINFSGLSSVMYYHWSFISRWTAIIAWVLYKSVLHGAKEFDLSLMSYIFLGFIFPFLMSIYPLFDEQYGPNDASCWIKDEVYF